MEFLRLLESARLPALDAFFSAVTYLGDELAFMALALLLFWCVDKRTGYYVFVVGLFGTLANQFLKILCRVPRPWVLDPGFTIVESARAAATVLVSVRAHAERRRHVWRHRPSDKAQMGQHRVPRAGPSCAVFADVSGGPHAAGCERRIFDGGNSARGVLPHFPLGRKNQRCHAVSSRGGHCACHRIRLLCQRHPRRLCPRLGGCEQSRACGQKRMDASGCNCGASYGLPCRPENAAV